MDERFQLCPHFGRCGGCLWQDLPQDTYHARKLALLTEALARNGLDAEIAPLESVTPRSRRRAALKAQRQGDTVVIGFHARESHEIVDMHACHLLRPSLFAALAPLRAALLPLLKHAEEIGLHLTETKNGLDLALEWKRTLKPALVEQLARLAQALRLARITLNGEPVLALASPVVAIAGIEVALPPRAFLQPSAEGEAMLQAAVRCAVGKAKRVADLFSGCGTFALALAPSARVHAVEADQGALAALSAGVRHAQGLKPVTAEKRNLDRLPLSGPELKPYDAVVLDPPRAGALPQARALAASGVPRLAYVSCNPASFARDGRVLVEGGYRLDTIRPVDQFLWSDHLELVAGFTRR